MTWSDPYHGTGEMRYLMIVGKGWSSDGLKVQLAAFPIELDDVNFADSDKWHIWTETDQVTDRVPW